MAVRKSPTSTPKDAPTKAGPEPHLEPPRVELADLRPDLADSLRGVREREKARDQAAPRAKVEAELRRQSEVLASARDETVASAVTTLAALKLETAAALDGVAARLVARVERLAQLDEAIGLSTRKLADLHDLEVTADALAVLLDKQAQAEADFARRLEEAREATHDAIAEERAQAEADLARAREEWEAELALKHADWTREQQQHDEARRERDEKLARDRKREVEEYDYSWKIKRQRDEEAFRSQQEAQAKTLAAQREAHDRALAQESEALKAREVAVAAREQEWAELKAEAESFGKRIETASSEARTAGRKEALAEAKTRADLLEKEVQGERELAALRVATLEAKVKEQAARLEELQKQLAEASTKVQAIAVKAIEGASGRSALQAVNEIALEQAKASRPG